MSDLFSADPSQPQMRGLCVIYQSYFVGIQMMMNPVFNDLLKNELIHISEHVSALLEPESSFAASIYENYRNAINQDETHNQNISILSIGEIQKYGLEEKEILSFSQFIVKRITTSGYNKNRFEQLIINNKGQLEEYQHTDEAHKFFTDLKAICSSSQTIARFISENNYQQTRSELDILLSRYPEFFPKYEGIIEVKPGVFGFSIDLIKLAKIVNGIKKSLLSKFKKT